MTSPSSYENIQQVPLAVQLTSRDITLTSDAYMKNAFIEKAGDQLYAVKRPGLKYANTITGLGLASTRIQGLSEGDNYCVAGDKLVQFTVGNTVVLGSLLLTTQTAGDTYSFLSSSIPPAAGFTSWSSSQFIYRYTTGIAQIATSSTQLLLPGFCELDRTYYVMDYANKIWSSAVGDITSWPALNYVSLSLAVGFPVRLSKHLNYLVAFATQGLEIFYDAGISPGAPIAPVMSAAFSTGIATFGAQTVVEINDETFWLSTASAPGYSVSRLSGLSVSTAATPSVERLVTAWMNRVDTAIAAGITIKPIPTAFGSKTAGHTLYILTFPAFTYLTVTYPGLTLVYDIVVGEWLVWTQMLAGGSEVELQCMGASLAPYGYTGLFPDRATGMIYTLDAETYQDNLQPINVVLQTELFNWGNLRTKFIPATYLLADTMAGSVTLSWTDDDYNTFSTAQTMVTNTTKKQLIRCGSTTQRAWRLTHIGNTPQRFYGLEVEVLPGAL